MRKTRPIVYGAVLLGVIVLAVAPACAESPSDDLSGEALDQHIERAAGYFSERGLKMRRTDVIMILFLLQDRFRVDLGLPSVAQFYESLPVLRESYFQLYGKYFDGRRSLEFPRAASQGFLDKYKTHIDSRTTWSFFCKEFPLPEDFLRELSRHALEGRYLLTHAALQVHGVETNGCWPAASEIRMLHHGMAKMLVDLMEVNSSHDDLDLRYETVVMLYYLGEHRRVKRDYIRQILAHQNADGGWIQRTGRTESTDHTSLLALWALLEYRESMQAAAAMPAKTAIPAR